MELIKELMNKLSKRYPNRQIELGICVNVDDHYLRMNFTQEALNEPLVVAAEVITSYNDFVSTFND